MQLVAVVAGAAWYATGRFTRALLSDSDSGTDSDTSDTDGDESSENEDSESEDEDDNGANEVN